MPSPTKSPYSRLPFVHIIPRSMNLYFYPPRVVTEFTGHCWDHNDFNCGINSYNKWLNCKQIQIHNFTSICVQIFVMSCTTGHSEFYWRLAFTIAAPISWIIPLNKQGRGRQYTTAALRTDSPLLDMQVGNCDSFSWEHCLAHVSVPWGSPYSISQKVCTRFCCALLCCGYAIVHNAFTWSIYPYSSGLLCWHWGNR